MSSPNLLSKSGVLAMYGRVLCAAITALIAYPISTQAASSAKGDFCDQLRRFESAALSTGQDSKPIRRYIEFQWSGNWMMGGYWGCRPSQDAVSKTFCAYLRDNTNQEFYADLPIRVLRCHGYVFPGHSTDWADWASKIKLFQSDDRAVDMDVYLIPGTVDAAVRISAVPWSWLASADDKALPPLKETPPLRSPKQ